jgi:shikimate dehydrogenase
LLGAGGAAASILAAIEDWTDAQVTVVTRHPERAAALAQRFPDVARTGMSVERAVRDATLIVNATPVGQHDEEHPADVALIPKSAAVLDLVYRRGGTPWVKAARMNGIRAADGLPMLLEQGALAFRRWFGKEPDREAMRMSLL